MDPEEIHSVAHDIKSEMFDKDAYIEASDNYLGYCTECSEWTRDCTEPDAEGYDCPDCGEDTVIGADNYLMSRI